MASMQTPPSSAHPMTHAAGYPLCTSVRLAAHIVPLAPWSPETLAVVLDAALGAAAARPASGSLQPLAILGLADDAGIALNNGRPGAKLGPAAFRAALGGYGLAEHADARGPAPLIVDAGDVIPGATLADTHARVRALAAALARAGFIVIGVGGGHDLTFPLVAGVCDAQPPHSPIAAGLYVDPHLDVRETDGSGMPFRQILETLSVSTLINVGFEPVVNSPAHLHYFTARGGMLANSTHTDQPFGMLSQALRAAAVDLASTHPGRAASPGAFVSLDLDSLDSSCAPGVSAHNPAGLTVGELGRFAYAAGGHTAVRCFDIMELSPPLDQGDRTARAAAYLFHQFLRGYASRTVL